MNTSRRSFLASLAAPAVLTARRPRNVLFIAVDDLRPALGCYGNPSVKSPHLDALAAGGLRFDAAYCQQAVCAPSRLSLLSGTRPDTTRVYDLHTPLNKAMPDVLSLPRCFRRNGYRTASLSKIYHHKGDDSEAWSVPEWRPAHGWIGKAYVDPESVRQVAAHDERVRAAPEATRSDGPGGRSRLGMGPAFERPDVPDNAYADGQTADRAVAELRRSKDSPFFLAVGFFKPHLPFNAPKKYWDLYDPAAFEPVPAAWPAGSPEIARTNWDELRSFGGIPRSGPVPREVARTLMHGYHACVSFMDAQVGRVLGELDRLGLAGNTVVVLWGDHGWKLNDYGAWCKHTNFEVDTRVPLLLSAPGQKHKGQATKALVELVDIYPTLAELCGLPVPAHCEGLSMAPLLDDPGRPWKQAAFSQYPRLDTHMGYSIRSAQWRYTEWIRRDTGEVSARELYDHSSGPLADRNLAGEASHAATVAKLSRLLDKGQGWRAVRSAVPRG